jgi:glyoxylase I family protein
MSSVTAPRPPVRGFHHVSLTVTDLEASVEWYQRLLELQRLSAPFPDDGSEENDHAIVLIDADTGIFIGLLRDPDNIQLEFFHLPT